MPNRALPHLQIEYAEHGDPNGAPVLLLHGFPDSSAGWQALVSGWRGEPVRWITPMQRGYGGSLVTNKEAESGEIAALASDAAALLAALGVEHAVVVGHDWGARASYALAVLSPERVRAVVALASEYVSYRGAAVPFAQQHAYWYQWLFQTPQGEAALTNDRAALGRYLWQAWSPTWRFGEEALAEAAAGWNNPQFVSTVLSYYRTRHGNAPGSPVYDAARARLAEKPKLTVPAWFLTGLDDACNFSEGSRGQEPWFANGYERVELPGVGHFVHREAAEAVAEAVAAALRST